jgi:DNA-binding transcriptional ArsR family regulator
MNKTIAMNQFEPEVMEEHAGQAVELLKSMANQSRLMILCQLSQGELSVSDINKTIPISQSALSQHLAALRKSDLVATRKVAQTIYYRLNGDATIKIIEVLQSIYCPTVV